MSRIFTNEEIEVLGEMGARYYSNTMIASLCRIVTSPKADHDYKVAGIDHDYLERYIIKNAKDFIPLVEDEIIKNKLIAASLIVDTSIK